MLASPVRYRREIHLGVAVPSSVPTEVGKLGRHDSSVVAGVRDEVVELSNVVVANPIPIVARLRHAVTDASEMPF